MPMSAYAKALNSQPKKNSKTQQEKREYLEKHPIKYVFCKKCSTKIGKKNVTLRKHNNEYYCDFCYEKIMKKENRKR